MNADRVVPVPAVVEGDPSPTYAACPLCHAALPYVDVLRVQYCEHCEQQVDPVELPDQPETDPEREGIAPAVCAVCSAVIDGRPVRYGTVAPLITCALALKTRRVSRQLQRVTA